MDKKIFPDEPEIPILPNLFTAGNLVCGFFAILTIFEGINQADSDAVAAFSYYQNATFLIFAACLFDLFDGRIARMRGQDGPFGREFDSLADIVSFGIAPALLVAKAVLFQLSPPEVGWGIGILYLLMYLAGRAPDGAMDLGVFKYVIALAMAGVSILMMSRVVYPSFKHINMRTRGTMYAIVFIVLAVICIFKFPWVMPAVIFSIYLLYGLVRPWVARRWRNRLEARDGE